MLFIYHVYGVSLWTQNSITVYDSQHLSGQGGRFDFKLICITLHVMRKIKGFLLTWENRKVIWSNTFEFVYPRLPRKKLYIKWRHISIYTIRWYVKLHPQTRIYDTRWRISNVNTVCNTACLVLICYIAAKVLFS